MSLYLGDQLISGVNTPVQGRVLGQIIQSTIPLVDAGLHLADGSILDGTGIYKDFYNYMMTGYENGIRISGTLTNNNGVYSGFGTTDNFIYIPGVRVPDAEYVFKFTTGSDLTTAQTIYHSEHWLTLDLGSNGNGVISAWNWQTAAFVDLSTISANTTYWIKVVCNSTTRTFSLSTNGTSYTQIASYSDNTVLATINDSYQFRLGVVSHRDTNLNPFLGSIDIKGCYIKKNNEYIWNGAEYSEMPNRYIDEVRYQKYISNYGVCGKYAIDLQNKTIRLPLITGILEGTLIENHIGNITEAGLPNITGNIVARGNSSNEAFASASGAMYTGGTSASYGIGTSNGVSGSAYGTVTFDASRSSSIYGNSNTVQPQTVKVYYYIVIATLTKTEIEVDIDEIATDLNGKADKDLANINYGAMRTALNSDDIPYITGTYRNGYSWHNIYSDGFVEQGGMLTPSGSAGYKEINLLVEMADTNFCVYTTRGAESTTTNYNVWAQTPNYTNSKTSIKVYVSNVNALVFWRVAGRAKTS